MDYLDVLDEHGDYTGRVEARDVCHKEGLWHRAVVLFLINSKNEVLLQKRSASKKLWPNMWDVTAGGHVLAGEFGFEAATREMKEELGIEIKQNEILFLEGIVTSNLKGEIKNNHFNEYFVCHKDVKIEDIKIQEEEVTEVKWFSKEEILEMIANKDKEMTDKMEVWHCLEKYYQWLAKK